MKKITLLLIVFTAFISCKKETPNFVSFSGQLMNMEKNDSLFSIKNNDYSKDIKINEDGSFKDTLHIKEAGYYTLVINKRKYGFVFLRNGFDLKLTADNNSFFESTKYTGVGANTTNYLIDQYKYNLAIGNTNKLFMLEKDAFSKELNNIKYGYDSLKKLHGEIDTMIVRINNQQNNELFSLLEKNYDTQHVKILQKQKAEELLGKGNPSPKFNNYLNYNGGKTSLDDFKGKYVYIDVWATWCKPCLAQIPFLKKLEKKYARKKIEFVSISTDNASTAGSWDDALSKWKKMVKSKSLAGVQLYAGKDSKFMTDYQVYGIPRFILVDPKGNIVNANAPRPSDPNLEVLFKELGI
jgi:thiol-disulfide isomerase/thioredoxin